MSLGHDSFTDTNGDLIFNPNSTVCSIINVCFSIHNLLERNWECWQQTNQWDKVTSFVVVWDYLQYIFHLWWLVLVQLSSYVSWHGQSDQSNIWYKTVWFNCSWHLAMFPIWLVTSMNMHKFLHPMHADT